MTSPIGTTTSGEAAQQQVEWDDVLFAVTAAAMQFWRHMGALILPRMQLTLQE